MSRIIAFRHKCTYSIHNHKRHFSSQQKQQHTVSYTKQCLAAPQTPNYNTHLMQSKSMQKESKHSRKIEKLKEKYKPSLPIYRDEKIKQKHTVDDILDGESPLLTKINRENDIYMMGNSQFINRKFEPLIEQNNNMNKLTDDTPLESIKQPQDMREFYDAQMEQSEQFIDNKKTMKLHEQWNFYFRNEASTLYNECETWNVIAHVNKRYSYGKSLRYSDRFYRNWAIRKAVQEDKNFDRHREGFTAKQASDSRSRW